MARRKQRGLWSALFSAWVASPLVAAALLAGAAVLLPWPAAYLGPARGQELTRVVGAAGGVAALLSLLGRWALQGDNLDPQVRKSRREFLAHLEALQRADKQFRCTEAGATAVPAASVRA